MKKTMLKKSKQSATKSVKKTTNQKNKFWLWVVIAFLLGGAFGYASHYTIVNWHGFFATCPNGAKPDKHGCCAGETYTDVGDGWMVCCPDDGGTCFPPVK